MGDNPNLQPYIQNYEDWKKYYAMQVDAISKQDIKPKESAPIKAVLVSPVEQLNEQNLDIANQKTDTPSNMPIKVETSVTDAIKKLNAKKKRAKTS